VVSSWIYVYRTGVYQFFEFICPSPFFALLSTRVTTRLFHTAVMTSAQDVDRIFLQAVLSRGLMSGELAKVLWERSIDVVNGKPLYPQFAIPS